MSVIHAIGGGFALDRHGGRDDSPFVTAAVDLTTGPEAMPLLIIADPVEPVPGAGEIAEDILHGMAVFLRHTMERDVNGALVTAFKTANERVYAENRHRNGMRRTYLGLSCVVLRGDELYVAQSAPSQVLVWQDGLLHAIPSLHTWSAEHITETFSDLSYPLGFHASVHPRISYSHCAPGDVIAVVSWPVARQLADVAGLNRVSTASEFTELLTVLRIRDATRALHGAVYEITGAQKPAREARSSRRNLQYQVDSQKLPLDARRLSGDSRGVNLRSRPYDGQLHPDDVFPTEKWLPNSSIIAHGFDTLGAGPSSNHGTEELPRIRFHVRGVSDDAHFYDLASTPMRFAQPGSSESSDPIHSTDPEHRFTDADVRSRTTGAPPQRKGHQVEIFAGLLLSLSAAVVGVWHVTKRDRPIHGPRDDGTLGLPHLQRWSDSYHPPRFDRIRSVSPRFQFNGIAIAVVVVMIVVLLVALVYSQFAGRMQERASTIDDQLKNIAAVRTQVESGSDGETSYESLVGAQVALDELESIASSDEMLERIADERAAVDKMLDTITSVERLTSVQVMGSIPTAPGGVTPRLFQGNGRVFIFSDGLFELDRTTGSLVHLLRQGDMVSGTEVGELIAAGWNDDRPLAVDASNAYLLEPATGIWHRVALGAISSGGHSDVAAVAIFDRNIYFLTPESGQILKFDALDFGSPPEDWTAGAAKEELREAVDLVVDGSIHVALRDGEILTFFRSALEGSIQAQFDPPLDSVSALSTGGEGQYFFLVNQSDGRIVCIDKEGNVVRQFIPAANVTPLVGATDLVVNESDGISHVIVGDTLYAVRLAVPR